MSDADAPSSPPPKGDTSGGNLSLSTSTRSVVKSQVQWTAAHEDARAAFMQAYADDLRREKAEQQQAEQQQQPQGGGGELPPAFYVPTSVSLQDGGPVAPRADDMMQFFAEAEKSAEEQRQSVREKDRRDAEAGAAAIRAQAALEDAWRVGQEKGNLILSEIMAGIAIQDGIRQHEGEVSAGSNQHQRDEDAGWREFKRNQDTGWREFDRTETSGVREQEKEERRRRDSGMSL